MLYLQKYHILSTHAHYILPSTSILLVGVQFHDLFWSIKSSIFSLFYMLQILIDESTFCGI